MRRTFITLTSADRQSKIRFVVSNIVAWRGHWDGQPGSVVVTCEEAAEDWHVAETPEQIDELIRTLI
jgi:hypothetical protein